ncbi:MAG TPA: response regulator transcription factor [Geodermatophilus sp.]|nr:response regulator transcription factor [Geodermatophilus sp.]
MAAAAGGLLAEGRAALDRGDWAAARSVFGHALRQGEETPDACYGLAYALEWAGDFEGAVRLYERAFTGYRERGEVRRPALIAGRELSFLHAAVYGNWAVASGWLARARSLAAQAGDCPERGWVELAEAAATGDPAEVEAHARAAAAIADRFGDTDLQFCALGYEGAGLVLGGRVAEGMRRVDEAALAASNGEVRDHLVVGEIYCKMLLCCEAALDVDRAQQWIAVADASGRASNDLWVSAICRMHHGGVLLAAGRWAEADDVLTSSLTLYDAGMRALRSGAAVRLADLRVRQGRLGEAAQLLAGAEFDPEAALPTARLHLLSGEPEAAAAVLRRFPADDASVLAAPGLALRAEVEVAAGRPADARIAQQRLQALAGGSRLPHVGALAEHVAGILCRAAGRDGALAHFEAALTCFARAGLPWEAARDRLEVARELAGTLPETAVAHGRAALAAFRELGAARDADEAAAVLRGLGARTGSGSAGAGGLTGREREVLRLVVEGLSNQQIAQRLFVSKRTVEHHVAGILAKLGVRTRAEAIAHALRHGME